MIRALLIASLLASCGPGSSSSNKPAGTLSDPVLVCERVADVCRLDSSRLGVCVYAKNGRDLACASQH